jgi:cysteine desulfurase
MVDPKVVKAMMPYFSEVYGNASSTHEVGAKAKRALADVREVVAKSIDARREEIIFTSGGTESNNLVLKGLAFQQKVAKTGKNHIITTKIEHSCVLHSCEWLEGQGFDVTYLDVDGDGFVRASDLEKALRPETFLVSVIHGNNEIGTVQDLSALGDVCKKAGVLFHTDGCQSYTKVPLSMKKLSIGLMTLNSHKIHGPKGVGALYVKSGVKLVPVMHGGGHEGGLRGGTENIPGLVGFAEAVKLGLKGKHVKEMVKMRDYFIREVLSRIEGVKLNGPLDEGSGEKRLCNNMNFAFPVNAEMLGDYLNMAGVCTSKGSACSANEGDEVSHVLKALGRTDKEAGNSIRFTISRFTTQKELDESLKILIKSVEKVGKSRFA